MVMVMDTALQTQHDRVSQTHTDCNTWLLAKNILKSNKLCVANGAGITKWAMAFSALAIGTVSSVNAENWQITPKLTVVETLTNNARTSAANPSGDLISVITPGISIDGKGARASLRLDYGLSGIFQIRDSSANRHQNSLNALGKLEAIEDWLFVDATGTITQQYLNPVGAVSPSNTSVNSNQTETSFFSVSPYVKGRLLSFADYLFRYRASFTSSKSNAAADLRNSEWSARVNGATPWSAFTWSVDAANLENDYSFGKDYRSTNFGGDLIYHFSPEWQFLLSAGQESNNYASINTQTKNTTGYGFVWKPGSLTELSAKKSKRFFGDGYDVSFKHRLPRSQITYRASKDVSFLPSGVGNTSLGTNYDLLYAIVAAMNPGASPNAIKSQVENFLITNGIPADGAVVVGSLSNSPHLNKSQELSMAFLGTRNTVTITATETERSPFSSAVDQLLPNRTRQRGLGFVWAHHLTGLTSLSLAVNHQQAKSFGATLQETTTDGAYLFLTTRISPKTQGNIGVRRVVSDGATHYSESALTGGFSHSF